jgi:hypothetical protein
MKLLLGLVLKKQPFAGAHRQAGIRRSCRLPTRAAGFLLCMARDLAAVTIALAAARGGAARSRPSPKRFPALEIETKRRGRACFSRGREAGGRINCV